MKTRHFLDADRYLLVEYAYSGSTVDGRDRAHRKDNPQREKNLRTETFLFLSTALTHANSIASCDLSSREIQTQKWGKATRKYVPCRTKTQLHDVSNVEHRLAFGGTSH